MLGLAPDQNATTLNGGSFGGASLPRDAGDPLELSLSRDGRNVERAILGNDLTKQQRPQIAIPAHAWQSAKPLGAFTLVGCTVAPAFEFKAFEMAPPDWAPGQLK